VKFPHFTVMAEAPSAEQPSSFASLSHLIDVRILRALADLGFARPTQVQIKTIPLALEGRDILARARTGSGKTAAYCVPIVQKVLTSKSVSALQEACCASLKILIILGRIEQCCIKCNSRIDFGPDKRTRGTSYIAL